MCGGTVVGALVDFMEVKDEDDHGKACPSERRRRSRQDQNMMKWRDFGE